MKKKEIENETTKTRQEKRLRKEAAYDGLIRNKRNALLNGLNRARCRPPLFGDAETYGIRANRYLNTKWSRKFIQILTSIASCSVVKFKIIIS
ncbi:MAG: hypothetical protein J6Y78_17855 [Paludibacteraceae bacterium]|nr:hypothetical protein [Paludibacteraceae bacterium]